MKQTKEEQLRRIQAVLNSAGLKDIVKIGGDSDE